MLCGHDRSLDDQDVELTGQDVVKICLGPLRGDRRTSNDPGLPDLPDPGGDQFGLHGCLVELLHPLGCLLDGKRGDLGEHGIGVLVAGPQALKVEHTHTPQAAHLDGRGGADHAIHRRCHQGQVEPVGVNLPADVDVLRVSGTPTGHDRDVVKAVRPTSTLAHTDLNLSHGSPALPPPGGKRRP